MIVVLMGVTGSGKSTIGELLARQAHAVFADADDYHSDANKAKMAAGHPLDDDDRRPWLETLNGLMKGWHDAGTSGVLACSALKESYRSILSDGMPRGTVTFCLLEVDRDVLQNRLAARHHPFMNASLLDSQIATLETPSDALIVQNNREPAVVADNILKHILLKHIQGVAG